MAATGSTGTFVPLPFFTSISEQQAAGPDDKDKKKPNDTQAAPVVNPFESVASTASVSAATRPLAVNESQPFDFTSAFAPFPGSSGGDGQPPVQSSFGASLFSTAPGAPQPEAKPAAAASAGINPFEHAFKQPATPAAPSAAEREPRAPLEPLQEAAAPAQFEPSILQESLFSSTFSMPESSGFIETAPVSSFDFGQPPRHQTPVPRAPEPEFKAEPAFAFASVETEAFAKVKEELPPWLASTPYASSGANVPVPLLPQQTINPPAPSPHAAWQPGVPPQQQSFQAPQYQPQQQAPRRGSGDSQRSQGQYRPHQPPLDILEESLSVRSFGSTSFVVEGSKTCPRCSQLNESLANYCGRCGLGIQSPIESPTSSQVCSTVSPVTTTSPQADGALENQMGRLSLSTAPAGQLAPPTGPYFGAQQPNQWQPDEPQFSPQPPAGPCSGAQQLNQRQPDEPQFNPQPGARSQDQAPPHQQHHHSPPSEKRVFPVMSFGFGGAFVMTFPSRQTRYAPTGQAIDSYRPSLVYTGDVTMLAEARSKLTENIFAFHGGAPFLEKAAKPKELLAALDKMKGAAESSEKPLIGLFELLMQNHGKLSEDPKLVEHLQALLAGNLSASPLEPNQHMVQCDMRGLQEVQRCLLLGDRAGACRAAMAAGLWSHAILLSHLAGPQLHQQVLAEFAQQDFPAGHPVRLMYLLLAGQLAMMGRPGGLCRP